MPRVADTVSDIVLRVPKPASARTSRSMFAADGARAMSYSRGSTLGGTTSGAAAGAAGAGAAGAPGRCWAAAGEARRTRASGMERERDIGGTRRKDGVGHGDAPSGDRTVRARHGGGADWYSGGAPAPSNGGGPARVGAALRTRPVGSPGSPGRSGASSASSASEAEVGADARLDALGRPHGGPDEVHRHVLDLGD